VTRDQLDAERSAVIRRHCPALGGVALQALLDDLAALDLDVLPATNGEQASQPARPQPAKAKPSHTRPARR